MDLWDLKDALFENKIRLEVSYPIDELDGLRIKGKHLKSLGFLQIMERHIAWRRENPTLVARYYPNMYRWQVYQYDCNDSPAFEIQPEFEGIKELVKAFRLPPIIYRSRIFSGNTFCLHAKPLPDTFRQYTVETLGVKIKPLPYFIAEILGSPLPDSLDYSDPPFYLQEKDSSLTEIWRLRIFSKPIEYFSFSPSTPLAPLHSKIPHFEHRWHPQKGPEEMFRSVEDERKGDLTQLSRFMWDALFILQGRVGPGRPQNSGKFPTPESFLSKYKEVQDRYGGKEPPLKELLKELDCSPDTYYKYARLYGVYRQRRMKRNSNA